MTNRQRILAAIEGRIPDHLPWVPRLDFWQRGRLHLGTLPPALSSLTLTQIADYLGVGCYATIPDFAGCPAGLTDRTLGLLMTPVMPYRISLDDVERRVTRNGAETVVEYHTPVGSIRTATVFTEEMLQAGATVSWVTEHALREPRDFDVVGHIFSHLRVEPNFAGYLARREELGERGLLVGYLIGSACPIQLIMKELMAMEAFFYALNDYPEKVEGLAEQIQPFFEQVQQIGVDAPAEVLMLGGNYDDSITHPRFFEKYILPALRGYAALLHAKGKYLMTHTDGENQRLFPLYRRAGFDVADSVCPYPMTRCTLEETRTNFGEDVTIWGGVPSTLLCASSTAEAEFRRSIDETVNRYAGQSHFVLGISDMVTADCEWDRLQYITQKVGNG